MFKFSVVKKFISHLFGKDYYKHHIVYNTEVNQGMSKTALLTDCLELSG